MRACLAFTRASHCCHGHFLGRAEFGIQLANRSFACSHPTTTLCCLTFPSYRETEALLAPPCSSPLPSPLLRSAPDALAQVPTDPNTAPITKVEYCYSNYTGKPVHTTCNHDGPGTDKISCAAFFASFGHMHSTDAAVTDNCAATGCWSFQPKSDSRADIERADMGKYWSLCGECRSQTSPCRGEQHGCGENPPASIQSYVCRAQGCLPGMHDARGAVGAMAAPARPHWRSARVHCSCTCATRPMLSGPCATHLASTPAIVRMPRKLSVVC